jgi:drug/metabolite transporter (DMT)-like permease
MSSEVIFTAAAGILFLGDPAPWRFWIGGVLILLSVIALNRIKSAGKPDPDKPEPRKIDHETAK